MIYWNWTKWMFHWCREINQCLFSSRALGLLSLFIPSCHFAHTNSFSLLPEPCLRPWQVSQPDVSKWSPSSQYWSTSDISRIEQKQSCSRESNLIRHNQLIQSPNTHLFLRQWGERKKQYHFSSPIHKNISCSRSFCCYFSWQMKWAKKLEILHWL